MEERDRGERHQGAHDPADRRLANRPPQGDSTHERHASNGVPMAPMIANSAADHW